MACSGVTPAVSCLAFSEPTSSPHSSHVLSDDFRYKRWRQGAVELCVMLGRDRFRGLLYPIGNLDLERDGLADVLAMEPHRVHAGDVRRYVG